MYMYTINFVCTSKSESNDVFQPYKFEKHNPPSSSRVKIPVSHKCYFWNIYKANSIYKPETITPGALRLTNETR